MANATYRGRMIVNDTDYTGSFVDPNPSGTATDTLTKLGIDGTVYDIKSGNGNFKTKVLLNQAATSGTYSLADDYTNYDLLAFWTTGQGYESGEAGVVVMTVDDLKKAQAENRVLTMFGYYNRYYNFYIMPSQFTVQSRNDMTVVKIVGYKIYADCYNPIIYSTEEREVGVWTNGKPLYAKTYNFNSFVRITNSGTDISQYIDNRNDIEILVRGEGFSDDITQAIQSTALWVGYSTRGEIMAYCAEGATVTCVTLYYTKITDTAGSGSYTTLGVPAHHYDGNEKIVGTWFGETLYEKTIHIIEASEVETNQYTTEIQSLNADKIFLINGRVKLGSVAGGIWINSPYYNSVNYNTSIGVTNTEITVVATRWKYTEAELTIQYTKTTD